MSIRISSFTSSDASKDLFLNKFNNIEQFYRRQDEKKSIFAIENPQHPKNSLKVEDSPLNKNYLTPRKSRQSIMFASPRKSLMFDSSKAEFLATTSSEKTRNMLKTVDLNKFNAEQLLDLTVTVLQKPANYRTHSDIKLLVKATENIKFFQEISLENGPEMHESLCKYMSHRYLSAGETVFHEGSIGSTFFIILKGAVSVCKLESRETHEKSHEKLENIEKLSRNSLRKTESALLSPKKLGLKKSESIVISDFDSARISKKSVSVEKVERFERNLFEETLIEVKVLETGSSFGELALIENKPRAATIKCKENCHFAVLDKVYFTNILKENEQKKLFQHIDFFSNIPLFKHWTYNEVKNLKLHSDLVEFKRNKFVYKENDPANFFYIVKSGEFKLVKELAILSDKDLMTKKLRETEIPKFVDTRFSKNFSKEFELALLTPGEFFGEEELLDPISLRKFSVICTHPGSLYTISKKEFSRRILSDAASRSFLSQKSQQKLAFRSQRIKDFVFSHEKANTFLKELQPHQALLRELSMKDVDLLLKTCDFIEADPFSEGFREKKRENSETLALKSRISDALSKKSANMQEKTLFFADIAGKSRNLKISQGLFDYFLKSSAKTARFLGKFNKTTEKINKTNENVNKTTEKLNETNEKLNETNENCDKLNLKHKKFACLLNLPCVIESPLRNLNKNLRFLQKNSEESSSFRKKNPGFLTDRTHNKAKFKENSKEIKDFTLSSGNFAKIHARVASSQSKTQKFLEELPLKYRTKEIYGKIFEKQRKIKGVSRVFEKK